MPRVYYMPVASQPYLPPSEYLPSPYAQRSPALRHVHSPTPHRLRSPTPRRARSPAPRRRKTVVRNPPRIVRSIINDMDVAVQHMHEGSPSRRDARAVIARIRRLEHSNNKMWFLVLGGVLLGATAYGFSTPWRDVVQSFQGLYPNIVQGLNTQYATAIAKYGNAVAWIQSQHSALMAAKPVAAAAAAVVANAVKQSTKTSTTSVP